MTPEEIAAQEAAEAATLAEEQEAERLAAEKLKAEETTKTPEEEIEAIVAGRLAKMKENMDKMATERDAAIKLNADAEAAAKTATIARMKEEGKLQEALELELEVARKEIETYKTETTGLKRDSVLTNALAGMDFKSEKSRDMARREIVDQLVQGEDGAWQHSTGSNIQDYVKAYADSEDNSFLFRVKSNTGGGTGNPNGVVNTDTTKKIGEMSTTEILALASKGKLGNFNL